ncbi:MAG: TVP38/TMEM64 family protein [Candidatus Wallbacteria bacterium]|nr:TVP38/TMEM64 family protein [Candidatus Wallbacteria bacterium]
MASLAIALAALLAVAASLPIGAWLLRTVEWIRSAGVAGALAYGAIYVLATVLMLPGSALTLGAGFAYGPLLGTLLVSPASVLGATLAFLLGRSAAREWVVGKMTAHPRFGAVDRAVGDRGFLLVMLLRLSPLFPFNLLNYALGATRVRLRDYVVASFVGMLPGTFLYVYLGSLVTSAGELLGGQRPAAGPWGRGLYWVGLFATVAVVAFVTRFARQALDRALESADARTSEETKS